MQCQRWLCAVTSPARQAGRGPFPRLAWVMGGLLVVAMLAGCATGRRNRVAAPPPEPVLSLDVQAPEGLDALLSRHLDLARVNRLAGDEPLSASELERLVDAAPEQARALLRTEGYFRAEVQARVISSETPPKVEVRVTPGPRTEVGEVAMRLTGPALDDAANGLPEAREALAALSEGWALPTGRLFRNEDWSGAKRSALAAVRAQGYVTADWRFTDARIDPAASRADLSGEVASGPLHRTGELRIEGLQFHDAETVRNLAAFGPGTPATEDLLLDFQERLRRSGLFDRGTVTLAPEPDDPAATPVQVRLTERQLQEATVGVGISANVGPRVSFEHTHRRFLGRALTTRNRVEWAKDEQLWDGEISTHTRERLWRNLVGAGVSRLRSDTDTVTSGRLRIGRAQETERISRLVFAEAERAITKNALGTQRDTALSAHYHGIWREVDDVMLPTRGRAFVAQIGGGQAWSEPGSSGPFARLYGRFNVYKPFGKHWYSQGRVELAQVFSRDDVRPPDSMLFRAGGDESVRGYSYRSLTPQVSGVDVSGKVLFTASAEIARPLLERLPELWGAAFVDVGRAAARWRDLDPAWGLGVGVRYRSPVGPVKLDLAWGEEVHRWRLHLSVGVSF